MLKDTESVAMPDYEEIMLPILKIASDGIDHTTTDIELTIGSHFGLTDAERSQLLPSGKKRTIYDRLNWARYYLLRAGLVDFPKRGLTHITDRGQQALKQNPAKIDGSFLLQYPDFVQFKNHKPGASSDTGVDTATKSTITVPLTPDERLQYAYQELNSHLVQELIDKFSTCSPAFFERLVVDLLVRMGYGGSEQDAAQVLGGTGDEGIDGTIKEDPLGLDFIYIQAKRWAGKVGRPDLQKFVGALHGQNARKGVFITTSDFTPDAKSYAKGVATTIVLIDGKQMANLMIRYNVGVSTKDTYQVKRMDSDYFEEA